MSHDKSVRSTDGFYAANHMLFTQHHVAKGLHIFGSGGETTVIKELSQLHMHDILEPQRPEELTPSEKAASLASLMFLKEKGLVKLKLEGAPMGENNGSTCPKKRTVHQLFQFMLLCYHV